MSTTSLTRGGMRNFVNYRSILSGNPSFGIAGYFAGGINFAGSTIATFNKLNFPTESYSSSSTTLSTARYSLAAMANSGVAGYWGGGITSNPVSTVDKVLFSNDSRSTLGTGLSLARRGLAAMADSGVAGYFGGGTNSSGTNQSTINKYSFATDASTTFSLGFGTKTALAAMANSGVAGYWGGGQSSTTDATVGKTTFPTDTWNNLGTALSQARSGLSAFANSGVAGYFFSGQVSSGSVSVVDKYSFPSDTRSVLGDGNLFARQHAAGLAHSGTAGYSAGGNAVSSQHTSGSDKLLFATDSISFFGPVLSSKTRQLAGAANSGIL